MKQRRLVNYSLDNRLSFLGYACPPSIFSIGGGWQDKWLLALAPG